MIKIRSNQFLKSFNSKNLATVANGQQLKSNAYKVVIVGGGSGGISVSAKLSQVIDPKHIAIVEPSDKHYYQPLYTFVGAGIKTLADATRPTASVVPSGVQWVQNSVAQLNPDQSSIVLADGSVISYDFLVVATGLENKWDKIKGLKESIGKNGVVSNYGKETVESTWKYLQELKEGNALFTMPSTPIKCAGAPQKIAYLTDDYLRERNLRDRVSVDYFTGIGKIFAIDKYGSQLTKICQSRDIGVHTNSELIEIDNVGKVAKFKNLVSNEVFDKKYNFLHVTPPMATADFVKQSPLANAAGFVDVDKLTLKHVKYDNVYSLGDCSSLPTSKTAAAITEQSTVLATNLAANASNATITPKEYSGYTSCPLITGKGKLILAEFSGYTGQPLETFPVDQSVERRTMYHLTKDVIPEIYWSGLLKGKWSGPGAIRQLWQK